MKKKCFFKTAAAVSVCVAVLSGAFILSCSNDLLEGTATGNLQVGKVQATYFISTATQMAAIGVTTPLDADYVLVDDIVLSNWTPIGDATNPFNGTFDGDNNTITITDFSRTALAGPYLGIFGYVASTGSGTGIISNLNVEGAFSPYSSEGPATQYVGTLVGYADISVVLQNVSVTGKISFSSESVTNLGGIAGYLNGASLTNSNATTPSTVAITATSSSKAVYVGGAVGYGNNGAAVTGVNTAGPVVVTNGAINTSAGGVIGYTASTTISNCSASGNVSVVLQRSAMIYAGGLAGYATGSTGSIVKCYATGTVTATSNYPYAGGLVGGNYASHDIQRSYATGNVNGTGNNTSDDSYPYVGGLAGYNSGSGSLIENCYATGAVIVQAAGYTAWIGGIAGSNANGAVISKTYSTGTISATVINDPPSSDPNTGAIVGGIVGYNYLNKANVEYSAALNPSISVAIQTDTFVKTHRVEGSTDGTAGLVGNIGNQSMTFSPPYSPVSYSNGPDGSDTVAQPSQTDYAALGWDFLNIWLKGATDSYPVLR
jgi:hypothetical protein